MCVYSHTYEPTGSCKSTTVLYSCEAGTSLISKSWDTSWSGRKIGKKPFANALIMDCSDVKTHVYKMRFCCCSCYCCFPIY